MEYKHAKYRICLFGYSRTSIIFIRVTIKKAILYDLFSEEWREILQEWSEMSYSAVISKQPINHTSTLSSLLELIQYPNTVLEIDRLLIRLMNDF